MICSFAYYGFINGNSTVGKYLFAFALTIILILLWGFFAAPKSAYRLPMPYLALFRLSVFMMASYFLWTFNKANFALVVALLAISTQLTSYFLERD